MKQLNIHLSTQLINPIKEWCENNTDFAPVVTKFNKQGQWTAISLKGYSSDPNQIGNGGVLGTTGVDELQTTPLYEVDTTGDIRATGIVRADGGLTTGVTTLVSNLNADLLDS